MLSMLLNRPVTIISRSDSGETDDYGNDTQAETITVTVGELQQQTSRRLGEPAQQGEMSDSDWLLILPAGTAIDTSDEIEVDGQVYEVVGAPWHARNPRTGTGSHVEATLRRTAGAENAS